MSFFGAHDLVCALKSELLRPAEAVGGVAEDRVLDVDACPSGVDGFEVRLEVLLFGAVLRREARGDGVVAGLLHALARRGFALRRGKIVAPGGERSAVLVVECSVADPHDYRFMLMRLSSISSAV